jgi:hypothetical protein
MGLHMTTAFTTAATIATSTGFADYLLLNLRCAELETRLMTNELRFMRIALGAGFIDFDNALEHLAEVGALRLIEASS